MRKGEVTIHERKGRLQLYWRFQGKRYYLATGFTDTAVNRVAASKLAGQIEFDMATLAFDETLDRYRVNNTPTKQFPKNQHFPKQESQHIQEIKLSVLWDAFKDKKREEVTARTFAQYEVAYKKLIRVEGNCTVTDITPEKLLNHMKSSGLSTYMCKRNLLCLSVIWSALPDLDDPWKDLRKRLKVPPKQHCAPFTAEEVTRIINGFRGDRYYAHYTPFVTFLFGTGVRTGEAIGLRWRHITPDYSSAWIGETISRGLRSVVKTNKARTIPLSEKIQGLLLDHAPLTRVTNDSLVFPSPEGFAIDSTNFRGRAWATILDKVHVPYRKPYNTRHTFISHCLEQRMNPAVIAQITGHSIDTLYSHYAGVVVTRPEIPEYF